MTLKSTTGTARSRGGSLICLSGIVLLLASRAGHGFWGGFALGAGIALCLLGAALLGAVATGGRWHRRGWWLPSRDRAGNRGAGRE
jgi:hypothetical protein